MGRNRGSRRLKLRRRKDDTPGSKPKQPNPLPAPPTVIGPPRAPALTGWHQLQEEGLLRAVPESKLPHDVAFPAGDRGAGVAGPRHGRPLPPAPRAALAEVGAAGRGGARRGLRDVTRLAGNPRVVPKAFWGENGRKTWEKPPPGSRPSDPTKVAPEWGLL